MHSTEPDPALAPVIPLPAAPKPKKVDGRSTTAQANGMKGGHPFNPVDMSPEEIIERLKESMLANGKIGFTHDPRLGSIGERDRDSLKRLCKMTVEEFNAKLADKFAVILDHLSDSILHDVLNNKLKPGEKAFLTAIIVDKRNSLNGQLQLSGANVQVTVNNFNGPVSRGDLMKRLDPNSAPITLDSPHTDKA